MKIQTKINIFSALVLVFMTVSVVMTGIFIITNMIYGLNRKILSLELDNIISGIEKIWYLSVEESLSNPERYEITTRKRVIGKFTDYRYGSSGYFFLVSRDRKIIIHPGYESGTPADSDYIHEMIKQKHGIMEYSIQGESRFCVFRTFTPWNWLAGLSVTKKELFEERTLYIHIVTMIALFFLFFVLCFTWFFSWKHVRRIEDTLECVKKVEKGDMTARIPKVGQQDEIGRLQEGVNSMIAERRRVVEELRAVHQRVLDIIEFLPDATFVVDQFRRIIAWNRGMEELTGVPKNRVIGKGNYEYTYSFHGVRKPALIDWFWNEDPSEYMRYEKIEKRNNILYAERNMKILHRKQDIYIWITASPLLDEEGRIMGAIESLRDVSEHKQALQRLELGEFSLNNSGEAAFWISPDARCLYVNQTACDVLGYTREEFSDLCVSDVDPNYPASRWPDTWKYIKKKGAFTAETVHRCKDGRTFPVEITGRYLHFDGEEYFFCFARDISERRKTEEELALYREELEKRVSDRTAELQNAYIALQESFCSLEKAQDQLVESRKMAALGGLVAGVAHEINTPVGIGVTASSFIDEKNREMLQLFRSGEMKRSDLEKYLETVSETGASLRSNLNRAARLINSFKQVATDQSSGEKRVFRLKTYIEEVLLSLRPNYKKTKHQISVNCPDDLDIFSWPGAFSQIITNLVMNSLVHGFEGMEYGQISFDISLADHTILFLYSDNGKGIPAAHLHKIFDPFFTTRREKGGTGLGLHIVYNIITGTMKGKISCESSAEIGIVFRMEIPLE